MRRSGPARLLTYCATTAKPRPASPARAASIVVLVKRTKFSVLDRKEYCFVPTGQQFSANRKWISLVGGRNSHPEKRGCPIEAAANRPTARIGRPARAAAAYLAAMKLKKRLWFLLAATAPAQCLAAARDALHHEPGGQTSAENELIRVIEVERDFAAASLSQGIKQSFLAYAAPDSVLFRPGPVAGVAALKGDPDDNDGLTLDWWPAMGAISRSGDLALSVGPWVLDLPGATKQQLYGYYATIWKKQPDGSWKFVIDGAGARIGSAPARQKASAVHMLPISRERRTLGSKAALGEVRALEASLARSASSDARNALASRLAGDAWAIGSKSEPDGTPAGWTQEIGQRPRKLRFRYLAGDASQGGDFAYTYGLVESLDPSIPLQNAAYLHVWQRREGEWRLIFQGIKQGPLQ